MAFLALSQTVYETLARSRYYDTHHGVLVESSEITSRFRSLPKHQAELLETDEVGKYGPRSRLRHTLITLEERAVDSLRPDQLPLLKGDIIELERARVESETNHDHHLHRMIVSKLSGKPEKPTYNLSAYSTVSGERNAPYVTLRLLPWFHDGLRIRSVSQLEPSPPGTALDTSVQSSELEAAPPYMPSILPTNASRKRTPDGGVLEEFDDVATSEPTYQGPAAQPTGSSYAVEFPHSARLKPINLASSAATTGSRSSIWTAPRNVEIATSKNSVDETMQKGFSNTSKSSLGPAATYQKKLVDVSAAASPAVILAANYGESMKAFSAITGRKSDGEEQQSLTLKLGDLQQRLTQLGGKVERVIQFGRADDYVAKKLVPEIVDILKEVDTVQARYESSSTRSHGIDLEVEIQKKPSISQKVWRSFREQGKLKGLIEKLNKYITELEFFLGMAIEQLESKEAKDLQRSREKMRIQQVAVDTAAREQLSWDQVLSEKQQKLHHPAGQAAIEPAAAEQVPWNEKRPIQMAGTQSSEATRWLE